jgi:hypothetical protein
MFILNYIEDHRWTWIPFIIGIKLVEFLADKMLFPEGISDSGYIGVDSCNNS